MSIPKKIRLGDLLIAHRIISQEQLEEALKSQKESGRKLGRELVAKGFISDDQLANLLSRQLNIPYVDLNDYRINPDVVQALPESYCRRFRVIPLEDRDDGLLLGMADPTDIFAYDELARYLGRPFTIAVVREDLLEQTFSLVFRRSAEMNGLVAELEQDFQPSASGLETADEAASAGETPVQKFLQTMFEDAIQVKASDIHIEPNDNELAIRLREDGVLRLQTTTDVRLANPLVSRLKLLAGLDIAEKRMPQDGRFKIQVAGKHVDVRLSTVPIQGGESVVMRLLMQSLDLMDLDRVGMPKRVLKNFRHAVHGPHGMILVTGPTGSGKSTTLYGALTELNTPEVKILTAEDPVEYQVRGINQVQVNEKINLSFARVLRAFLRQDPDVILIGEIRDQETAEIGMRAAMTGHLVLSSLHTNDAISTPLRLMDMGVAPFLIAASLRGVLAQRLVRRVCKHCIETDEIEPGRLALLTEQIGPDAARVTFKKGRGCAYCNHTGYKGRIGIYEWLELDRDLIRILQGGELNQFGDAARAQEGYRSLKYSALTLAAKGITSVDEVLKVTYGVEE